MSERTTGRGGFAGPVKDRTVSRAEGQAEVRTVSRAEDRTRGPAEETL
ncbi:hypothetical protein [Planobispora longispora]|uniref:Uncharacterized protein n=1 Tax=Planobispora longispora TaxID=28887 RepID=A0A8J3RNM9_9ACTN|nr:hypothetical protein [Planobispora longispora]BFE83776.1 hypothetical protein GCM10020093_063770 [Planobispora longispora]GIH78315.1 hypothetical protein Plo01_47440 [Planobispora longispora]